MDLSFAEIAEENLLYAKRKGGFHKMRPERARALSRRGTRTVVGLANDYAHTYAPFIRAAVREVGHNYRQVAKWLTREQIPAQRAGQWKAQSVKNLVVRYWGLTGRRILIPYKKFPTPAHRHRWA
jgi:recombinase